MASYSFLVLMVCLALVAALVLLTRSPRWNDYLAFGIIVFGLISAWVTLHPRQTPLEGGAKEVQEMIGAGTPVLLEFQSPYCLDCAALGPVVDHIGETFGDRLHVIRVDLQSQVGRQLAPVYNFEFTPTFVFFDAQGTEVWRTVGEIDEERVRDSLE
jgi:thiol-disulfide isomerase/thioredoxin